MSSAIDFSLAVFIKALPSPSRARDLIAAQRGYLPKINVISYQAAGALPASDNLYSSGRPILWRGGEAAGPAV